MKWSDKVAIYGEPIYEQAYVCIVKHYCTGSEQNVELIAVDEEDHLWVTADDRSELDEWNWNVISWNIKKGKIDTKTEE